MDSRTLEVIDNYACTVCGCVCDDLRLTVDAEQIVRAERACALAEPWLLAQQRGSAPVAEIEGRPASLAEGVARAAALLDGASYPLIYGLSRTSIEGQRAAVALAEQLGGVIDTTASVCHAPSVVAQQLVGQVTCTLGEVRNRADLVIFWGSDPARTHPRHWERYSVHPASRQLPRGRAERFVVVADTTRTQTAEAADLFLPIEPGRHFEALHSLRALVRGVPLQSGAGLGAAAATLAEMAERMRRARVGVIFFGVGLARSASGHCMVQALLQLVTDLNAHGRRWYAMRMRVQGNVVGADTVLLWQTGFPFAVNLARGFPRYNPGEFSVEGVLERQEADACLLIGSETLGWLAPSALAYLQQIPTVLLDPADAAAPLAPTVRFRVATPGIHLPGMAYRMDGVPIPLRAVLPARYPSDAAVLQALAAQLKCDRLSAR